MQKIPLETWNMMILHVTGENLERLENLEQAGLSTQLLCWCYSGQRLLGAASTAGGRAGELWGGYLQCFVAVVVNPIVWNS